jgi:hypothetical protein
VAEDRVDNSKESRLTVSGQILIPAIIASFRGATAHIRLEELKGEDTAARVVTETIIQDVSHESGGEDTAVLFTVQIAPRELIVSSESDYTIRVWIDYDSDGERGPGDLYSDVRHSVCIGRADHSIDIKVVQR